MAFEQCANLSIPEDIGKGTLEIVSNGDGGRFFGTVEGTVCGRHVSGVRKDIREEAVDEGDEEESVVEHAREMSRLL